MYTIYATLKKRIDYIICILETLFDFDSHPNLILSIYINLTNIDIKIKLKLKEGYLKSVLTGFV